MSKQKKYTKRVLTDEIYAELAREVEVLTIPHAMVIAGNAYRFGGGRMAENAAMLAMLIAMETGGYVRRSAEIAWNAAESIEESRS
jgi:hypothetical protein